MGDTKDVTSALPVIEAGRSPAVTVARIPIERRVGWETRILLTSDWHFDSIECDRGHLKRLLEEAKKNDWSWCAFGDIFDAMGGKFDPRSSKSDIRPEYQRGDYLDAIVQDCSAFISPYARNCIVLSPGNHEESVKRRHETDLVERLVAYTNRDNDSGIRKGTYQGWIQMRVKDYENPPAGSRTINLRYHHGHGGGGEVTQGVIQAQRRAVYLPDAHIVANGHIHYLWQTMFQRERITTYGSLTQDCQLHVGLSTFKDEYSANNGYHVEKGRGPRPLGGWWIRLYWCGQSEGVMYDAQLAR